MTITRNLPQYPSARRRLALALAGLSAGFAVVVLDRTSLLVLSMVAVNFAQMVAIVVERGLLKPAPAGDAASHERLAWAIRVRGLALSGNAFVLGASLTWVYWIILSGPLWMRIVGLPLAFVNTRVLIVYLIRDAIEERRSAIAHPPMCRAARLLRWLLPARLYVKCVEPMLADLQVDYFEAIARGQNGRAAWLILLAYTVALHQLVLVMVGGCVRALVPWIDRD